MTTQESQALGRPVLVVKHIQKVYGARGNVTRASGRELHGGSR